MQGVVLTAHSQRGESSQSLCYAGRMDPPPPAAMPPPARIHPENPASSDLSSCTKARHKLAVLCGTVGEVGCLAEPPLALPIADAEPQQHPRLPSDSSSTLSGLAPRSERARYQLNSMSEIQSPVQPGIIASLCICIRSPLSLHCVAEPQQHPRPLSDGSSAQV